MRRIWSFGMAVAACAALVLGYSDGLLPLAAQSPSSSRTVDWALHNLDLAGSRFPSWRSNGPT